MPAEIQSAAATAALVDEYGIKGRFRLALDDIVVPTVIVGDLRSVEGEGPTYQGQVLIPATVGEIAAVSIAGGQIPDFPFTTVLHRALIRSTGTAQVLDIRTDNTTAFTLTAPADIVGVNRLNPEVAAPSPIVAVAGTLAAAPGTLRERIALPADTDVPVNLNGWELPAGPATLGRFARLVLTGSIVNVAVRVSLVWSIRESTGTRR